jgi:CheY-like chemotaxis protein
MRRVLVVGEDDVTDELSRVLEAGGYAVTAAREAREALTAVAGHHPDVVVLKARTPETVGNAAAEWILIHLSRLPVILCTAAQGGCDLPVAAVVRKSDGLIALRRAVARLCRRGRSQPVVGRNTGARVNPGARTIEVPAVV